jgi:hypothetical protein
MNNVDEKTLGFIDLCIKKIILHLDETSNSTKLQEFNNFFVQDPSVLKIIYNTVPYNDSVKFITDYYNIGPPSAHKHDGTDRNHQKSSFEHRVWCVTPNHYRWKQVDSAAGLGKHNHGLQLQHCLQTNGFTSYCLVS